MTCLKYYCKLRFCNMVLYSHNDTTSQAFDTVVYHSCGDGRVHAHDASFSCHSYPLISTHIPFDPHSTSMLVPPSLSSGASRCSRGSTPHRSLVMFATALLHQDLSFYPSMVCWALALHTHTTWFPSPPSGAVLAL